MNEQKSNENSNQTGGSSHGALNHKPTGVQPHNKKTEVTLLSMQKEMLQMLQMLQMQQKQLQKQQEQMMAMVKLLYSENTVEGCSVAIRFHALVREITEKFRCCCCKESPCYMAGHLDFVQMAKDVQKQDSSGKARVYQMAQDHVDDKIEKYRSQNEQYAGAPCRDNQDDAW